MKWLKTSLLELCNPRQWPTISSQELTSSGYPVYGANGQIGYYHSYNHEEPTILITCRGATCGTLNISPPKTYTTGNAMALDDIRSSLVDFKFLYYSLLSRGLKDTITGAAQPQITRKNLSIVTLSIPPLSEQKRIVEILDRADELRKQRAEADALSERILPALFIKMFGDPATNPMGWDVVDLGDLIKDGPQNGLYKPASFYGEGTPILRIDSFYDGVVDTSKELKRLKLTDDEIEKYKLFENDIIINRVNGSRELFGKSALIPNLSELTVFESNIMKFSVFKEKIHPIYVIRHLQTTSVKQQILNKGKHINQYSVNQGDLKSLKILLPPYSLQESFAKKITETIKINKYQSDNTLKINYLFQNLLYRAFSGDLTAKWREAHMTELLQEIANQTKALKLSNFKL